MIFILLCIFSETIFNIVSIMSDIENKYETDLQYSNNIKNMYEYSKKKTDSLQNFRNSLPNLSCNASASATGDENDNQYTSLPNSSTSSSETHLNLLDDEDGDSYTKLIDGDFIKTLRNYRKETDIPLLDDGSTVSGSLNTALPDIRDKG